VNFELRPFNLELKMTRRIILPVATALAAILAWHLAVLATGTTIFPLPGEVARGIVELARRGILADYIGDSLFRVLCGYLAAAILGIATGLVLGRSRTLDQIANPIIQMMRPISPLAWLPLAIIWFGVTNAAPIFLIFLASFFPIIVATTNAVRGIPPVFFQAASNFGLSRGAMIRRVVFPAIVPRVLTGLRVALGIAWMVVVAAEMLGVESGLGYLIIDARNAGARYDLVIAGMLMIGVIGLGLDVLMRRLERIPSVRWGFR